VTKGKIAVYVSTDVKQYCSRHEDGPVEEPEKKDEGEEGEKNMLLGYLNVGSNFNHMSAMLSHQSILSFYAVGNDTQLASITKAQFIQLCEQYQYLEKYRQFLWQLYNESGKKYDLQRYYYRAVSDRQ